MKAVLGLILMVAGLAFGIWAGLLWAFVGGIIDIVHAVQASPAEAGTLAWGIVKIIFSSFIGVIATMVAVLPGYALLLSA